MKKKILPLLTAGILLFISSLYILQHKHTLTALFYQSLKMPDKAIDEFKKAVASNPKDAYSFYQLGLMYKERKEFDNAEDVYKLLNIFPDRMPIMI
jgi:tetratricopeptide (TPR) repeat protein